MIGSEKYWLLKVKNYYLEYKRIPIGQYDKENLPRRKIDTKSQNNFEKEEEYWRTDIYDLKTLQSYNNQDSMQYGPNISMDI